MSKFGDINPVAELLERYKLDVRVDKLLNSIDPAQKESFETKRMITKAKEEASQEVGFFSPKGAEKELFIKKLSKGIEEMNEGTEIKKLSREVAQLKTKMSQMNKMDWDSEEIG